MVSLSTNLLTVTVVVPPSAGVRSLEEVRRVLGAEVGMNPDSIPA